MPGSPLSQKWFGTAEVRKSEGHSDWETEGWTHPQQTVDINVSLLLCHPELRSVVQLQTFSSMNQVNQLKLTRAHLHNNRLHRSKQGSWLAAVNCWSAEHAVLMHFNSRLLHIILSTERPSTYSYFSRRVVLWVCSSDSAQDQRAWHFNHMEQQYWKVRVMSRSAVKHHFFKFCKVA